MKKDARTWILIGALVIVAGLFAAFLWSVMASPSQPAGSEVVANVSETPAAPDSTGDKPADGQALTDETPPVAPPPNLDSATRDAEDAVREAREAADRALAEARRATERARQQARGADEGEKPPEGDKPPEDW